MAAIALQKVDSAGDPRPGKVNRSSMKCFQLLGSFAGADIHPTMLESAVNRICAVQEFSLHPFDIAEARAVGELVEHTGGNQLRQIVVQLFGFGGHILTVVIIVVIIDKDIYFL
jgi:3-polyprenyl-4-hydroxybenzoate decarboxylase